MINFFERQNIYIISMMVMAVVGATFRLFSFLYMKKLIRETEQMGVAKSSFLSGIRRRYEDMKSMNMEIRKSGAFVGRYMGNLKWGPVSFRNVKAFFKNIALVIAGTGIAGAYLQYFSDEKGNPVKTLAASLLIILALCATYNVWDINDKEILLKNSLENYICNSMQNRWEKETKKKTMRDVERKPTCDEMLDNLISGIITT